MPLDRPPQLYDVPAEHIDRLWPQIEGLIEAAVATARGAETAFDVRRMLNARDAQLWIWWDAGQVELLAITELKVYPRRLAARIKICTGRATAERMRACVLVIEAWARAQGATAMRHEARKGYARVLAPLGYTQTHVVLEKDL